MTKTLGLDIGTNSLGWCLTQNDQIVAIGVRIFSDGRDPKSGASLAVDRRNARAMRRRRDRYIGRRAAFLSALIETGLLPGQEPVPGTRTRRVNDYTPNEATRALARTFDPYELRARATAERLDPYALGRLLFHLNQRRGFLSNRKAERRQKDQKDGKIETGAKALDGLLKDRTLGQFLADRLKARQTARVRMGSEAQAYDFYPQRRHVRDEFEKIWAVQAHFHPDVLTDAAREKIARILFYQRKLKDAVVGFCTFAGWNGVPDAEKRLPKAHPLFQERRLYEEVNQLRILRAGEADRLLSRDQRDTLILKLRDKKKVSFVTLGKLLKLADDERFNKASDSRKDLIGDEVRAELADKKRFGARWGGFSAEEQARIVTRLLEEEDPDTLIAWLKDTYSLDDAAAEAAAAVSLPEGYGRFGETATRLLLAELKADVLTYSEAAERAGFHHSDQRTGEAFDSLPYYGAVLAREIPPGKADYGDPQERRFGKLTNPTVHIGMRQLQKIVNDLIAQHGKPDRIVIELARDLKLNEEQKEKHRQRIKRDTDAAIARGERLQEAKLADTGANRQLLRLWEELNPDNPLDRRCPYCAQPIGMRQLFSGGEVDIDHIIPYSRSLDDSQGNKTIAHRSCNRAKGRDTPWEWGLRDPARRDIIATQVLRLHVSKQWRFGPDALEKLDRDGGFLQRQLTDTQYLSRLAGKYLRCLYPTADSGRVDVIPGRMTAMLRRIWGLNSLLPDHNFVENPHSDAPKNRRDHRHHAIDAAVTAVTSLARMQQIATAAGRAEDQNLDRLFADLPQPWTGFRDDLFTALGRLIVSHKADHGRRKLPSRHHDVTAARLHNDTAYGLTGELAADGKTPIVVHRVPLQSLKFDVITSETHIPDAKLREALQEAIYGLSEKEMKLALADFAAHHPLFKGIRRVRVREALNVLKIKDQSGKEYKAYKGDSNARYDVWRLPDGKWKEDLVTTFEAHDRSMRDRRPHPAAKKILSLCKDDMVAVERTPGTPELMRVVKFTKGKIYFAPPNEAGDLKQRDTANRESDPFKYFQTSASTLKKLKARQVRIDATGRVFDPGPRDG
jgi:CRISPR-associated endonuclease Csn1